MKLISAVIHPNRLPRVREAARKFPNFPGMTIEKVDGFSVRDERPRNIRAELSDVNPRTRVLIICADDMVDPIFDTIHSTGHSGEKGDGHVWVTSIEAHWRLQDDDPRVPSGDREAL